MFSSFIKSYLIYFKTRIASACIHLRVIFGYFIIIFNDFLLVYLIPYSVPLGTWINCVNMTIVSYQKLIKKQRTFNPLFFNSFGVIHAQVAKFNYDYSSQIGFFSKWKYFKCSRKTSKAVILSYNLSLPLVQSISFCFKQLSFGYNFVQGSWQILLFFLKLNMAYAFALGSTILSTSLD